MSDTPKQPPRRSRTRTEVEGEFSTLAVPQRLSEKEKVAKAQRAAELRSAVVDTTAEKAATALASAGVAVQKSIATVSEELTTKIAQLNLIKENVATETEELTRLYGARVISEHLDVLVAEHDEKKQALALEIETARSRWAEEREQTAKDRQREVEDHTYSTSQYRKQDLDKWAETVRVRKAEERDRQEVLEREWAERSKTLLLAEQELTSLRTAVAGHQAEIDKAAAKAEAIVANRLTKDHQHATQLLEKDRAAEKALYEADKKSLSEQNARLTKLNEELQIALAAAHQKNVEVANKALETASGQRALDAVQSFAKDQSNGPVKRS